MILTLGNVFFIPNYFTDRFITSGIIWLGITIGGTGLLFSLITKKISLSSLSCIIIGGGVGILCYRITNGLFSFQQMTFGLSLGLAMIIANNANEYIRIHEVYFLLLVSAQLEALFAIVQWCKMWDSHFMGAHITGTFENPAGLSAYLSICLPIALYFGRSKLIYKSIMGYTTAILFFIIILLSGSRTGIIALAAGFFISMSDQRKLWARLSIQYKIMAIIISITLFASLYFIKKDSADGRMLIWNCTWEMIKDSPLTGQGPEGFTAKYMNYQAEWLRAHPGHPWYWLADDIKHPFNEFLKIAAEYGILGVLFLAGLLIVGWFLYKQSPQENHPAWHGLTALAVCSLFSYPLTYPSISFLLFFLAGILGREQQMIELKPRYGISIMGCLTLYTLSFTIYLTHNEIQWANLVSKSAKGEIVVKEYGALYPFLHENPYFLYNYGAELHKAKEWGKSTALLEECCFRLNDTEIQSLLADNYYQSGEYDKAEQTWKSIKDMRPILFLPLYNLTKLYITTHRESEALQLAKIILNKPIKIPSYPIYKIQKEMKQYIESQQNQSKLLN